MKKVIALLLVVCLSFVLTGCLSKVKQLLPTQEESSQAEISDVSSPNSSTPQPTVTIDYNEIYEDLAKEFALLIRYRFSGSYDPSQGVKFPEISEKLQAALSADATTSDRFVNMVAEMNHSSAAVTAAYYGYILSDLNADGIPEQFWVRNDHTILAVFTLQKEKPVLLDAYWSRYQAYVSSDNALYTWGSNGAADNRCRILTLNSNATLTDSYGFYSKSIDSGVGYYEHTVLADTAITQDRFHQLSDMYPHSNAASWRSQAIQVLPTVVQVPTNQCPYRVTVPRGDYPIWSGPGYNYSQTSTVKYKGVYTIVEEQYDSQGNLWGRLKSGVGWIDLTQLAAENGA